MGSKTFDGVWFLSYSDDHEPPHVHGRYSGTMMIIELLPGGGVARSSRSAAIAPKNAKRSDVRRILKVAIEHSAELHQLWEATHGTTTH